MGCLMSGSAVTTYQDQISKIDEEIKQLEKQLDDRSVIHDVNEVKQDPNLGYWAYQEQIRATFIVNSLKTIFEIENPFQPPDTRFLTEFPVYGVLKTSQTENTFQLLNEVFNFLENSKKTNEHKQTIIDSIYEEVSAKGSKNKTPANAVLTERLLSVLKENLSRTGKDQSIKGQTDTWIRRSDIGCDVALIDRVIEFKDFLEEEKRVRALKAEAERIMEQIKEETKELSKAIITMKTDDLRFGQRVEEKKQEAEDTKHYLTKYGKDYEKLKDSLRDAKEVNKRFDEFNRKIAEKQKAVGEINEQIAEIEKKIEEVRPPSDYEFIEKKSKGLKKQAEDTERQIDILKANKLKRIQDGIRMKHSDLESKSKKIREIKEDIKSNQSTIEKTENETRNELKRFVVIRILRNLKKKKDVYFQGWKKNWLKVKHILQCIRDNMNYWESERLYAFFNEFMKDKAKYDQNRINLRQIPKATTKYLTLYMKRIYKNPVECEKELARLIQTVFIEEKTQPLSVVIKKLIGQDADKMFYHADILTCQLWNEFNLYLVPSHKEQCCRLFDALGMLQDYIGTSFQSYGQRIVMKWKPYSIEFEDYLLLILKFAFLSYDQELLKQSESADLLVNFLKEQTKIFIHPRETKRFFEESLGQTGKTFVKHLGFALNKLDETKVLIKKSEFLLPIIEIVEECIEQAKEEVINQVKAVENLTPKEFELMIRRLDPGLEDEYVRKILFECDIEEHTQIFSISGYHFADVLVRYGIGGLGVGPFKTNQLRALLDKLLKKDQGPHMTRRLSKDVVPYKVKLENVDNTEVIVEGSQNPGIIDILPSKTTMPLKTKRLLSPSDTGSRPNSSKFFRSRSNSPNVEQGYRK